MAQMTKKTVEKKRTPFHLLLLKRVFYLLNSCTVLVTNVGIPHNYVPKHFDQKIEGVLPWFHITL